MRMALALVFASFLVFAFALEGAVLVALAVPPRLEERLARSAGPAPAALACRPGASSRC